MNTEIFTIKTEDNLLLDGYLVKNNNSKKIIISTHGMSSNCFKERDNVIKRKAFENGIDYLAFNNRGSELVKYITVVNDGKVSKSIGGTTYEDPLEGYYDIKAMIKYVISLGYEEIYLQGHSLGCTKTVYTYNRLKKENDNSLNKIKGIILLSLVDIPRALKIYLKDKFVDYLKYATTKDLYDIMPADAFIHPISVKSFLRYAQDNDELNFAQYSNPDYNYEVLNNIKCPLFIRWGNDNEMIEQPADKLVELINSKITNALKDISYIDGANHGYNGKEDILANQIISFIGNI